MIDKIDPSHLEGFDSSDTEALESLYSAVLSLENVDELHRFFKDLCSYNELCSMIHRWEILRLIHKGMNYEEIIREFEPEDGTRSKTRVSSTTISRVKKCYNNPDGGYRIALQRIENKNKKDEV
ncbi:MAG: hypothetical protein J5685_12385 [Clostridiales bacterium]|nr:hypothetical protein [Clostridiales bacterium]